MKIIGCIPAKGSSERIPSKNRREILGVPLFLWAANNLSRVLPREDIYIDTDNAEIAETARSHGFGVIDRPAELATNKTDGNELMIWQASQVEADIYVQHLPPMLFLRPETILKGIEAVRNGSNSALTVHRSRVYQWRDGKPAYDIQRIPNSFELDETVIEGMGFYVTRATALAEHKCRVVAPFDLIDMDVFETLDIDYPEEFEFAEAVAKGLGTNHPLTTGIVGLRPKRDIKMVVFDLDGVLTDGGIYYSDHDDEIKRFDVKDGMAIRRLVKAGYQCGFLTHSVRDKLIRQRASVLGVQHVYVGDAPKLGILDAWRQDLNLAWDQIAYVGDDVNDLEVMDKVGLSICPNDAVEAIRMKADVVIDRPGGRGCVRAFIDTHLLNDT